MEGGTGTIGLKIVQLRGRCCSFWDGRSDSPGHSAKYGVFTVIEQRVNKVLDVELVQVHVRLLTNIASLGYNVISVPVLSLHFHQ